MMNRTAEALFWIGRYMERAENSLRILNSYYLYFTTESSVSDDQVNYNRFIILLKSAAGYEAFRKLYADYVTFEKVTEFLLSNQAFPHSVRYSLFTIETCLSKIKEQDDSFTILAEKAIDFIGIIKRNLADISNGKAVSLRLDLIHEMVTSINSLGIEISNRFFQEESIEA